MFAIMPVNAGSKYVDRGLMAEWDYGLEDFISDGGIYEKDLSAKIGKGVKYLNVQLGVANTTTLRGMFLWTHGQDNTKNYGGVNSFPDGTFNEQAVWVLTDKDGKIDYRCQSATWTIIQFTIRGWFEL